jgi:hypothetical protein
MLIGPHRPHNAVYGQRNTRSCALRTQSPRIRTEIKGIFLSSVYVPTRLPTATRAALAQPGCNLGARANCGILAVRYCFSEADRAACRVPRKNASSQSIRLLRLYRAAPAKMPSTDRYIHGTVTVGQVGECVQRRPRRYSIFAAAHFLSLSDDLGLVTDRSPWRGLLYERWLSGARASSLRLPNIAGGYISFRRLICSN